MLGMFGGRRGERNLHIATWPLAAVMMAALSLSVPVPAQESPADICMDSLDRPAGEDGQRVAIACLDAIQQNPSSAGLSYALARTLHGMQRYERSIEIYTMLANGGFAPAQSVLGTIYYNGDGIAQDYALAAEWTRKAAEQGNGNAQNNLGLMYYAGRGVEQSHQEALKWLKLAADQGHEDAARTYRAVLADAYAVEAERMSEQVSQNIAELDTKIEIVSARVAGLEALAARDYARAVSLLHPPAEAGDMVSQHFLGLLYVTGGDGVAQDVDQAVKWWTLAAQQGFAESRENLEQLAATEEAMGMPLRETWRLEDIKAGVEALQERNYRRALDLLIPHAEYAMPSVLFDMGRIFLLPAGTVPGVEQNRDEAIRLLRLAAAKDYEPAVNLLRQIGVQ